MSERKINRDCALCRMMRSMAFSGLGAGLGGLLAWMFGASKQNVMMTAIVFAAIFAFGLAKKFQSK